MSARTGRSRPGAELTHELKGALSVGIGAQLPHVGDGQQHHLDTLGVVDDEREFDPGKVSGLGDEQFGQQAGYRL
ncbi:hypothetical protein [Nocardia sp. XZ_19_231]|uniref:hypothetical protein n=1 Tax=Nocardia sp. XZ_19_231 TaxID=2769252 RepID=UPI00188FA52E|nr:hypothetical protein [Nocardia sp. XZ_19_231]